MLKLRRSGASIFVSTSMGRDGVLSAGMATRAAG